MMISKEKAFPYFSSRPRLHTQAAATQRQGSPNGFAGYHECFALSLYHRNTNSIAKSSKIIEDKLNVLSTMTFPENHVTKLVLRFSRDLHFVASCAWTFLKVSRDQLLVSRYCLREPDGILRRLKFWGQTVVKDIWCDRAH